MSKINRRRNILHVLCVLIMISMMPMQQGCATMKIKRAQKNAMKVEQRQEKEALKMEKKLVKRQKKIQTDITKKRIKDNQKRSKKYNEGRRKERKFFLWRWLGV